MFIVFSISAPQETPLYFETKKEAFEKALELTRKTDIPFDIYKASLIGVAEKAVTINKVRKQKIVKQEVFEKAKDKLIEKKVKPTLLKELLDIAKDPSGEGEVDEEKVLPLNARCSLDGNMAVGRKKGPTGEYSYLCVDCMGAVING